MISAKDFKTINMGIWVADVNGQEFVYQIPCSPDKNRKAQSGPVLFINGESCDVKDLDEALMKCSQALNTDLTKG